MSKHTPEPWVFSPDRHTHDCFIHAANAQEDCGYIDPDDGGIFGSSEWNWFKPEDAQRAVACVNSLAGLNPEAVQDVVAALRALLEGYERLLAQSVLDVNPGANRYSIAARAALAKLEQ